MTLPWFNLAGVGICGIYVMHELGSPNFMGYFCDVSARHGNDAQLQHAANQCLLNIHSSSNVTINWATVWCEWFFKLRSRAIGNVTALCLLGFLEAKKLMLAYCISSNNFCLIPLTLERSNERKFWQSTICRLSESLKHPHSNLVSCDLIDMSNVNRLAAAVEFSYDSAHC